MHEVNREDELRGSGLIVIGSLKTSNLHATLHPAIHSRYEARYRTSCTSTPDDARWARASRASIASVSTIGPPLLVEFCKKHTFIVPGPGQVARGGDLPYG